MGDTVAGGLPWGLPVTSWHNRRLRCWPKPPWVGYRHLQGLEPPFACPRPSGRVQQEQMEKEKAEEARRAGRQLAHANDVRRQMRERQQQLARERVAAFEECRRLEEEARQRSQRIAQFKQQKMRELR